MQTATADPLVGRTLEGRYRILDRIARGGMSTVYTAVDERLDRMVAVKVMAAALSADPAFSDRFRREARAAARLTHVNAVAVYDQGSDSGDGTPHVFLVMELVEGRTLRALLRERGSFKPAEALSIMEPVLSALSAAHHAGLVHRDVKPENILISDDGVVKVADFGLARAVEADAESTRTGLMMGTVAYCAPEQLTRGYADQRSDVYAAGVLLFELLTGKPPFQGDSAMNVAYQHVHSRVPAPSSRVKGIPSEIDELVVAAADREPEGRPADAGEFLAAVADVRAKLSLPVVPVPTRPRPPRRAAARNGAAAEPDPQHTDVLDGRGHAGRHDTQIVHRSGSATPRRTDAPPPPIVIPPKRRQALSPQQRRRRRGLIILLVVLLLGAGAGTGAWWFASGRYSKIPSLRGQTLAAAQATLDKAGYKLGTVNRTFSETVPNDRVISSDPAIDSRAVRGSTVDLTLSKGKDRLPVAQVAGMSLAQAQAALQRAGITNVKLVNQSNDTVKSGLVIGTDPPANTQVKRDQQVTVFVSTGPPILQVPSIAVGTPYPDAEQTLKDAGFAVARVDDFSDTVPKDQVIGIAPSDHQVKFGTITVTVSKGPQMVKLPHIRNGTAVDDATATLEKLGLNVRIEKAYGGFLGKVVGMDPKGGKTVPVGSTVTLTVV